MSPAFLNPFLTKTTFNVAMVFLFIVVVEIYVLAPLDFSSKPALQPSRPSKETPDGMHLCFFGETMVVMLGTTDLPFTIFIPSNATFQKFFKTVPQLVQQAENSLTVDNSSYLCTVLSHVFQFGAIPKPIFSHDLLEGHEIEAEALSGYKLYLSRVPGRGVLVNNLLCEFTDLRRGFVVMHMVNGVLLDPAFARFIAIENEKLNDEKRGDGG